MNNHACAGHKLTLSITLRGKSLISVLLTVIHTKHLQLNSRQVRPRETTVHDVCFVQLQTKDIISSNKNVAHTIHHVFNKYNHECFSACLFDPGDLLAIIISCIALCPGIYRPRRRKGWTELNEARILISHNWLWVSVQFCYLLPNQICLSHLGIFIIHMNSSGLMSLQRKLNRMSGCMGSVTAADRNRLCGDEFDWNCTVGWRTLGPGRRMDLT